jgi:hypothetical protein
LTRDFHICFANNIVSTPTPHNVGNENDETEEEEEKEKVEKFKDSAKGQANNTEHMILLIGDDFDKRCNNNQPIWHNKMATCKPVRPAHLAHRVPAVVGRRRVDK